MTLSTRIEVFTDFTFVRSGPSYMQVLLSRVPFALAGLSCYHIRMKGLVFITGTVYNSVCFWVN